MLTTCSRRPQCAIKDNDEALCFVLAAGDDGDDDDDDCTDAAKAWTFTHKRHSHKHIRIEISTFLGVLLLPRTLQTTMRTSLWLCAWQSHKHIGIYVFTILGKAPP